eukprot:jgi/Botrbrau1/18975/Bobra.0100s0012.1
MAGSLMVDFSKGLAPRAHPVPVQARPLYFGHTALKPRSSTTQHHKCRLPQLIGRKGGVGLGFKCSASIAAGEVATLDKAVAEDKWVAQVLTAFGAVPLPGNAPQSLLEMRAECAAALRTQHMPTTRNEEYRFTDLSAILQQTPQVAAAVQTVPAEELSRYSLGEEATVRVVVVDGLIDTKASNLGGVPEGTYIGPLSGAPEAVLAETLGRQARVRGSPFALVNGATASDAVAVVLPAGAILTATIHILYVSTSAGTTSEGQRVSSPRALIVLGKEAEAKVLEEFITADGSPGPFFCNAVTEIYLGEGSNLRHGYVELEGEGALHMKATLVEQATRSSYAMTEARLGGSLSRQDISILQEGEETNTEMSSFLLAGREQLHDLHSKLRLCHPQGIANQIHKCIVAAPTGRGVFDGNVKVERFAQQTDAQQLSRNLLLAPQATVNVKPNLQIIADDVKCTHGCAVSDLEEDQLFYFQARGIDAAAARKTLVYSFGKEVVNKLPWVPVRDRIQAAVNTTLAVVDI